jgi:phosphohistidine swiveling domain-containing protein/membrane-associated phospholipid phosphatase
MNGKILIREFNYTVMSVLNNLLTIFAPLLFIGVVLFWKKNAKLALGLVFISSITVVVNVLLKKLFQNDNNTYPEHFQLVLYNFPSLSAQLAFTFWTYLGAKLTNRIFYGIAAFMALWVGYYKISVRQHSIMDIIGGLISALLVVVFFLYFENRAVKKKNKWTRLAIVERFPDPLTPLFQDVIIPVYAAAARKALKQLRLDSKNFMVTYKIFNGYIYNNYNLARISKFKLLRLFYKMHTKALTVEQKFLKEILPRDNSFFQQYALIRWEKLSNSELWRYLELVIEQFKDRMTYESIAAYFFEAVIGTLTLLSRLVLWRSYKNYSPIHSFFFSGENESTLVDKQIIELVRTVRRLGLSKIFETKSPKDILARIRQKSLPGDFIESFNNFMGEYHFRLINYDFIFPTWGEQPEVVIAIITSYISANIDIGPKIVAREKNNKEILLKIENIFASSLVKRLFLRRSFYKWLGLAEKYNLLKEARYNSRMVYFFWLKMILLHVSDNLTGQQLIEQRSDIFFLRYDELKGLVDNKKATEVGDLRSKIRSRQKEREQQYELTPPFEFVEGSGGIWKTQTEHPMTLSGVPVSQGKIKAVCKVITTMDEFNKLKKGEILIARTTNPAWTALFAIAGGVVTEVGGLLCHAAIVSREYNIPAVVGVKNATKILADGDFIELNASKGSIQVLNKK